MIISFSFTAIEKCVQLTSLPCQPYENLWSVLCFSQGRVLYGLFDCGSNSSFENTMVRICFWSMSCFLSRLLVRVWNIFHREQRSALHKPQIELCAYLGWFAYTSTLRNQTTNNDINIFLPWTTKTKPKSPVYIISNNEKPPSSPVTSVSRVPLFVLNVCPPSCLSVIVSACELCQSTPSTFS